MPAVENALDPEVAALLRRDPAGLVAAVVQQHDTGEVLMLAWMDDEALHRTLTTGRATYWSRSRREHWVKGETAGHRQWVREVRLDCDGDALLVLVDQEGPAGHSAAGVGRAGQAVVAVQLRRGPQRRRAHRARRRRRVAGRGAPRADRRAARRPAGRG